MDDNEKSDDSKSHRLYRVKPQNIFSKDEPCDKNLGELLLNFDDVEPSLRNLVKVHKVVTVPWEEFDEGWKVAACQLSYNGVLQTVAHNPIEKTISIYEETRIPVLVKDPWERYAREGWKGLFKPIYAYIKKTVFFTLPDSDTDTLDWDSCDVNQCQDWYHYDINDEEKKIAAVHKFLLFELEMGSLKIESGAGEEDIFGQR